MINRSTFKIMALCVLGMVSTNAQPNLNSREIVQGLLLYPDIEEVGKYYYAPLSFELDRQLDGTPNLSFVQMTHIPSRSRGLEEWKQNSMIQFTVRPAGISSNVLRSVKSVLKVRKRNPFPIKLVPLPIRKMETGLIYTDLDADTTYPLHTT